MPCRGHEVRNHVHVAETKFGDKASTAIHNGPHTKFKQIISTIFMHVARRYHNDHEYH